MLFILDVLTATGFLLDKFPTTTHTTKAKESMVFFKSNDITYTEDICASLCYTHIPSTPACHFFSYYNNLGCMLGNFDLNGVGSQTLPNIANLLTVYYNESK